MSPTLGIERGQHGRIYDLMERSPFPEGSRFYIDAGGLECPCGHVLRHADEFVEIFRSRGLQDGVDYLFRPDPQGKHEEEAWRYRLPGAMQYLLA